MQNRRKWNTDITRTYMHVYIYTHTNTYMYFIQIVCLSSSVTFRVFFSLLVTYPLDLQSFRPTTTQSTSNWSPASAFLRAPSSACSALTRNAARFGLLCACFVLPSLQCLQWFLGTGLQTSCGMYVSMLLRCTGFQVWCTEWLKLAQKLLLNG